MSERSENVGFRARVVLAAFNNKMRIEYTRIYRLLRLYYSLVNSFGVLSYIFALKFAEFFFFFAENYRRHPQLS